MFLKRPRGVRQIARDWGWAFGECRCGRPLNVDRTHVQHPQRSPNWGVPDTDLEAAGEDALRATTFGCLALTTTLVTCRELFFYRLAYVSLRFQRFYKWPCL